MKLVHSGVRSRVYTGLHEHQTKTAPVQGERWQYAVGSILQEVLFVAFCIYCILHPLHSASMLPGLAHQQHHAKSVLSQRCHSPGRKVHLHVSVQVCAASAAERLEPFCSPSWARSHSSLLHPGVAVLHGFGDQPQPDAEPSPHERPVANM